ncbi:MAG: hypothetical protein Sapg2KO_37330 [Saprospiraceae bacterium]
MKQIRLTVGLLLCTIFLFAQETTDWSDFYFEVDDLNEKAFVDLAKDKLKNSQFVMVGEQHGIQEVAKVTDVFYQLGQPEGYRYLCVETDPLAARFLTEMQGSPEEARLFYQKNPMSIPFYNNEDDHFLFENVLKHKGTIWGIDQTMMAQFRLNFSFLLSQTKNQAFKKQLTAELALANAAYKKAIEQKKFDELYIFNYDKNKHKMLQALAKTSEEKDILKQLWETRTIYNHYWQGEYYQNNNVRGNLMKQHFSNYYKDAQAKDPLPKVVFKLGANHAAKGLTRTNIYDISNLAHELANFNGMESVHIFAMGISGEASLGNPFAPQPIMTFDNKKQFPEEIKNIIEQSQKKYLVIDVESMRKTAAYKKLPKDLQEVIFAYDLLILINDCKAVNSF